jgi:hypothetical protein
MRIDTVALAGRLALLEADRGNRTAADDALVENRRLVGLAGRQHGNPAASAHSCDGDRSEMWRYGVAQAVGDDASAHSRSLAW